MSKKFLDLEGLTHLVGKIKNLLSNKVDVVTGKGLSTNDFTDELKEKLMNAGNSSFSGNYEDLINKPTIGNGKLTIQKNGEAVDTFTANASTNKTINIEVPTNNNELTNGAGYQTADEVESAITSKGYQTAAQVNSTISGKGYQTASQVNTAISNAIAGVTQFEQQVVEVLPTNGVKGTIYLVSNFGSDNNIYDEFIFVNNKWEKIGTTEIDLSGYVKESDLSEITNAEIDSIFED